MPVIRLTPRAKLWASPIRASAASVHKIAQQLQRSLGRLHTKPLPVSRPGLASAREARRSDDRRERVAHHPTTSPHHPVPGSRRILLRAHSWCDPLANAERLLGRGARRLPSSGAPHSSVVVRPWAA